MIPVVTRLIELLLAKIPLLARLYCLAYRWRVDREIALARVTDSDHILCIGSGPVPATAIVVCQQCGARVVAADCDAQAVAVARKLVKKLGLAPMISIVLADGRYIDSQNFSVVHISRQVSPQQAVVDNIIAQAKQGTRVIVRVPPRALSGLYANSTRPIGFHLAGDFLHRDSTLCFTRRDRHEKGAGPDRRVATDCPTFLVG